MSHIRLFHLASSAIVIALAGCGRSPGSGGSSGDAVVFFNVTVDGSRDPQRLDMAMKLAGFSLDEKRKVVMFFNVKGVHVPAKDFPADRKYKDDKPIQEQLKKLIERGADVHVCPICMKALGVNEEDLIEGAKVTTRKSLFANIGGNTAVFTY